MSMKIFILRKLGTDNLRVVQDTTLFRAIFLTGWKEEEVELLGTHSIKGYLKDEAMFDEVYKKTAKSRKEKGL